MREMLPKIRTSQHGSDPLWKSEKHRRRSKTGDAVGRARWRSPFLGAPGVGLRRRPFFGPKDGEYFRRAKISWDRGDVAPGPRSPVSQGDRKEMQATVIRRQFFDEAGTPGLDSLLYRRSSCFPMAHVDF